MKKHTRPKVTKKSISQRNAYSNVTIGQLRKLIEGLPEDTPIYTCDSSAYQAALSDGWNFVLEIDEMVGIRLRGTKDEVEYIPVEEALATTSGFDSSWEMVGRPFKALRIAPVEYDWLV